MGGTEVERVINTPGWEEAFIFLGGAICEDSNSNTEICRITSGANAWRNVEVWCETDGYLVSLMETCSPSVLPWHTFKT